METKFKVMILIRSNEISAKLCELLHVYWTSFIDLFPVYTRNGKFNLIGLIKEPKKERTVFKGFDFGQIKFCDVQKLFLFTCFGFRVAWCSTNGTPCRSPVFKV